MAFLFILLLAIQPETGLNVGVSKGKEDNIPQFFLPLDSIAYLEINTSYWAKVDIHPTKTGRFILQGGNFNMKRISFFDEDGMFIKQGNHLEIALSANNEESYYLYYNFVDEKDKNLLSIAVASEANFLRRSHQILDNQMIFQSILLFPLMVAFFFSIFNQKKVYGYYALYILTIMLFFGYQYGLAGNIIDFINDVPPIWIWFFSFLITVFYLLFSSAFLDLKSQDRFSYKLVQIAIGFITFFFLVSVALYLLGIDVQRSIAYKAPFLIIEVFLIIWFVIRIFKHPYQIKVYYLSGFFILFVISISGQFLSASQSATDYNHLFQIGLVLEVFILALGLGARVNEIQKAEIKAKTALIDQLRINEKLQNEYAERLKQTVQERTLALTHRNNENELLLKEVHHRVKNNLQMITSMINMYCRRSDSEQVGEILSATKNKIKSMALIHEHLYSHEDFSNVRLNEYLIRLTNMLIDSLHKGKEINLKIEIEHLVSDIQTSISLGLILNELITNSLKYALGNHSDPVLCVVLKERNKCLLLIVSDNGKSAQQVSSDGLGYTIIKSILDNMDGELKQNKSQNGYEAEIKFRDYLLAT